MKGNPAYQYVHFQTSGYVYIFYKIEQRLFVKILKDQTEFLNKKISDNVMEFAVEVDTVGIFHLVCLITNGEVVYWKNREFQWHHRILTKYDHSFYKFKGLKVYLNNQNIHILLAIADEFNPDRWTLKHHYWNNTVWHNKKVCEINCGKYDNPYHGDIDTNNHIHIVYKSKLNGKSQIFYCKFNMAHNIWSTPQKISTLSKENSQPFILCDQSNKLHVTWCSLENGSYEILYRNHHNNATSKSEWSELTRLSVLNTNCTHPTLLQYNDELTILWKQNNDFYIGKLQPNEEKVSEPTRISLPSDKKLFFMSVIGNSYKHYSFVKLRLGYCMTDDQDIYILGLDQIPVNETNPPYIEVNNDNHQIIQASNHSVITENIPSLAVHAQLNTEKISTPLHAIESTQVQNINLTFKEESIETETTYDFEKDIMHKITVIEDHLKSISEKMLILTNRVMEVYEMVSLIEQQGFRSSSDMLRHEEEKSGFFRWFK